MIVSVSIYFLLPLMLLFFVVWSNYIYLFVFSYLHFISWIMTDAVICEYMLTISLKDMWILLSASDIWLVLSRPKGIIVYATCKEISVISTNFELWYFNLTNYCHGYLIVFSEMFNFHLVFSLLGLFIWHGYFNPF